MIESVMLLIAFIAFAALIMGWTMLPHTAEAAHTAEVAVPATGVIQSA